VTSPIAPPKPPTSPAAARPPSRGNLNPLLLVLTVVFLITTILFGLMALAPSSAPLKTSGTRRAAQGNTEEKIKDVSTRFMENLLTYKYQTVDSDFERTLRDATPEFSTRPLAAFDGLTIARVKSDIKSGQATSSIDVKGAAITSQDSDTATVLVVGVRTWDSNKRSVPAHVAQVIELTLQNSSDGWKVDNASNLASAG